jgi:hypothetical protein
VIGVVGLVAYIVELLPSLVEVHIVFHVLQLRKCIHDPSYVINYELLDIQLDFTYEELSCAKFKSQKTTIEDKDHIASEGSMAKLWFGRSFMRIRIGYAKTISPSIRVNYRHVAL